MNVTELIELLKEVEFDEKGESRIVNIGTRYSFFEKPKIKVDEVSDFVTMPSQLYLEVRATSYEREIDEGKVAHE